LAGNSKTAPKLILAAGLIIAGLLIFYYIHLNEFFYTLPDSENCPPIINCSALHPKTQKQNSITRDFMGVYFDFTPEGKIKLPPAYNKIIIDIGADNGMEASGFAVVEGAWVLVFEPLHSNQPILERALPYPNTAILPAAVGPKSMAGIRKFWRTKDTLASSIFPVDKEVGDRWLHDANIGTEELNSLRPQATIIVDVEELFDMLPFEDVERVWIDAQGADFFIVKGLRPDQLVRIKHLVFEWIDPQRKLYVGMDTSSKEEIIDFFTKYNYDISLSVTLDTFFGDWTAVRKSPPPK